MHEKIVNINKNKKSYELWLKNRKGFLITTDVPLMIMTDGDNPNSSFMTFYKTTDCTQKDVMASFNTTDLSFIIDQDEVGKNIWYLETEEPHVS